MPSRRSREQFVPWIINILLRVPPVFVLDELFKSSINLTDISFFDFGSSLLFLGKLIVYIAGCLICMLIPFIDTEFLFRMYISLSSVLCVYMSYSLNCALYIGLRENELKNNTSLNVEAIRNNTSAETGVFQSSTLYMEYMKNWTRMKSQNDINVIYHFASDVVWCLTAFIVVLPNLIVQFSLSAWFYGIFQKPSHQSVMYPVFMSSFVGPSIIVTFGLPYFSISLIPVLSVIYPMCVVVFDLVVSSPMVVYVALKVWNRWMRHLQTLGFASLLESEWQRLQVPNLLRAFWILRMLHWAVLYIWDPGHVVQGGSSLVVNATSNFTHTNMSLTEDDTVAMLGSAGTLSHMIKMLLIAGCENQIAILGMTSVVSLMCQYLGILFHRVLFTEDLEKNFGTVSGVLFFILALQTGLTTLEPPKRYTRICKNFHLLFTAMLHIVHGILNAVLMTLSASQSAVMHRHLRAYAVSLFLILYPISLMMYLWSHHTVSTWLLAVTAFSIEVIVKVIISFIVYMLFLMDSWHATFWEELDDYVYYVRAIGSVIEFCFGIFLFFNGAYILCFESGGTIRALMMCIHAYFNIWCEARSGWAIFMKRRTAAKKINTLPDATEFQLERLGDVCSICYQQMKTAKITSCKHYFHAICLRKWLYLQDHCPLCHTVLYHQERFRFGEDNIIQQMRNERRFGNGNFNLPFHVPDINPDNDESDNELDH